MGGSWVGGRATPVTNLCFYS